MKKKDYDQFMRHCQTIRKVNEDKTLLRIKQTQEIIVLKYIRNATQDLIPVLSQEKQINNEHLQSIIDYYQLSNDTIAVFTQYSTHTLEQQIIARRNSNSRFSYQELENILVSVLKALNYLESKSIGHGCISLKDIVISNNGVVKLIDPCLATSSPLNLVEGYYYSPQLLYLNFSKSQKQANKSFNQIQTESIDFFKNDVFVLAFIVIQAGLLDCSLKQCIKLQTGSFDFETLSSYFEQFQSLFGNQPFIHLLFQMLQQDSFNRVSSHQALRFIQQTFESEQDNQEQIIQNSVSSSNVWQSRDKTVRSFLLSQSPSSSIKSSIKQIQLVQSSVKTAKIPTANNNTNKIGRKPLIRC